MISPPIAQRVEMWPIERLVWDFETELTDPAATRPESP
jgi:hypothetical protein